MSGIGSFAHNEESSHSFGSLPVGLFLPEVARVQSESQFKAPAGAGDDSDETTARDRFGGRRDDGSPRGPSVKQQKQQEDGGSAAAWRAAESC